MGCCAAFLSLPPLALLFTACGSSGPSGSPGDLAAQTDLETALHAAQAQYQQTHDFSQAAPPELEQFASSITWLAPDFDATPNTHEVGVSNGGDNTNQTLTLAAASTTGTCWYLVDVAHSGSETLDGDSGIGSAGIWYGHTNGAGSTCNAPDDGPPMASMLSGGWSSVHFETPRAAIGLWTP
jgi:hypothetical protein